MDLTVYDVIKGVVVTTEASKQNQNLKKLVLWVHPESNKPMVKTAIEKLFDVKVDRVNIQLRKGKSRRTRRGRDLTKDALRKMAFVTLKEGYALNFFDQAGQVAVAENEV